MKGVVGIVVAIVVLIAIVNSGHHGKKSSAASSNATAAAPVNDPSAPPGDNLNYRTRQFVRQFRLCQAGVAVLASQLQTTSDAFALSDGAHQAKQICDNVNSNLRAMDMAHFYNQGIDAQVAIDDYSRGCGKVSDFIDTSYPSDLSTAKTDFGQAGQEALTALEEINARRAVYGLSPLT